MPDSNLHLSPDDLLVRHAFRGSSFAVVRLEELNEISNLKADAVACYRPANSQELFAVERIALCQQAIIRGYRLESGLFTTALDYALDHTDRIFRPMTEDLVGDGDIEITRAQNRNFAAGEGFRQMSIESDVWALLTRYQVNADRQYRRAIEDFERLKRLRPEMPNQPGIEPKPEPVDDLASFRDLGYSHLDHRPPVAPAPAAGANSAPIGPQPVPAGEGPQSPESRETPRRSPKSAATTRPAAVSQPSRPAVAPAASSPRPSATRLHPEPRHARHATRIAHAAATIT
jgi:hypothetical protein